MPHANAAEDPTKHSEVTSPVDMDTHGATSAVPAANPNDYAVPQSPQATLGQLPEELIVQVAEYLPTAHLELFSRTNKRHKRIADALS